MDSQLASMLAASSLATAIYLLTTEIVISPPILSLERLDTGLTCLCALRHCMYAQVDMFVPGVAF